MGVVYQALEPSLGRRVALKVVRSGPSAGSHDYARWLREARSFARVRHDNVVRLYQVGEAGGWLYMVLELVPGGTLKQRLKAPYAPRDAALLLETIAKAVIAIHREGLVHLDLKPSNILLDAGPETPRERAVPRVADFGLAFRTDDSEASLATALPAGPAGTPSYMAPEQVSFDRQTLGPAADVYGLGAILYHLLTGPSPIRRRPTSSTCSTRSATRRPVARGELNPQDSAATSRPFASSAFRRNPAGDMVRPRPWPTTCVDGSTAGRSRRHGIPRGEKTWRWCPATQTAGRRGGGGRGWWSRSPPASSGCFCCRGMPTRDIEPRPTTA